MPLDDEDSRGPDEFPKGIVIDVTPKKKTEEEIDFDSDTPLIEQILKKHKLDRTDKTESQGCLGKTAMLISLSALIGIFIISLFERLS